MKYYLDTELKCEKNSQRFLSKSNWIVFTGPPSSGKITSLKELEKFGFKWVPEEARNYIETEM